MCKREVFSTSKALFYLGGSLGKAFRASLDLLMSWKECLSSPRLGRTAGAVQDQPSSVSDLFSLGREKARFLGRREDKWQWLRLIQ